MEGGNQVAGIQEPNENRKEEEEESAREPPQVSDHTSESLVEPPREPEMTRFKRLLYRGMNGRAVYVCLLLLFVTELVLSYFLYEYISTVEKMCLAMDFEVLPTKSVRKKRNPILLEDNAVTSSDDAVVEFFNPKLKQELSEKGGSKHGSGGGGGGNSGNSGGKYKSSGFNKGSIDYDSESGPTPASEDAANDPYVWLTSYSRIPVS